MITRSPSIAAAPYSQRRLEAVVGALRNSDGAATSFLAPWLAQVAPGRRGARAPRPFNRRIGAYRVVAEARGWRASPERVGAQAPCLWFSKSATRPHLKHGISAHLSLPPGDGITAGEAQEAGLRGQATVRFTFDGGIVVARKIRLAAADRYGTDAHAPLQLRWSDAAEPALHWRLFGLARRARSVRITIEHPRSRRIVRLAHQSLAGANDAFLAGEHAHRGLAAGAAPEPALADRIAAARAARRADAEPSGQAGCFLTTACCVAVGLPDDCWELRVARAFRDGWLAQSAAGREETQAYYRIAPKIVASVEAGPAPEAVWRRLYAARILPICLLARLGLNRSAHRLYRRMLDELAARGAFDRAKA
ncbi:MAG: CFI-box-CTERM domain-containing protein [Pseudomonadota bacterium]